jgi:hypothetical protein
MYVGRRHRPAKQVSLNFVDTIVANEQFELFLSLDAFDHNVEPQLCTQARHAAQQGDLPRVIDKSPEERLIDLDFVERKAVQIAKAGVGGTEVIQRNFPS